MTVSNLKCRAGEDLVQKKKYLETLAECHNLQTERMLEYVVKHKSAKLSCCLQQ